MSRVNLTRCPLTNVGFALQVRSSSPLISYWYWLKAGSKVQNTADSRGTRQSLIKLILMNGCKSVQGKGSAMRHWGCTCRLEESFSCHSDQCTACATISTHIAYQSQVSYCWYPVSRFCFPLGPVSPMFSCRQMEGMLPFTV